MKKIYNLQFTIYKSLLLVFTFYILHSTFYIPISAAESTPSSQTATQSANTNTIQDKIDALKQEIASKAAALKSEVNKKIQNKLFKGKLILINSDHTLKLEGDKNILTNEYTTYEDKTTKTTKKTKLSLDSFKNDDYIIALGDVDDKNMLLAKKIIKIQNPSEFQRKVYWGEIQEFKGSQLKIITKDKTPITVNLAVSTQYHLGNTDGKLADLKTNKFIIVSGIEKKENTLDTRLIYIIPSTQPSNLSATPSASSK